jgi:hypothetical protein
MKLMPVRFPPGRASDGTSPLPSMSSAVPTNGMVRVACCAAVIAGVLPPGIRASGANCTSSAAAFAVRSGEPTKRQSTIRFLPSTKPALPISSKKTLQDGASRVSPPDKMPRR